MRVTMTQTRRGSEDGFTVAQFVAGETYDLRDVLARSFLRKGYAVDPSDPLAKYTAAPDAWLACVDFLTARVSEEAAMEIRQQVVPLIQGRFRPQPTRGSVPTNPATLAARGDV